MNQTDESPSAALRRLTNGYQVSQAIHVAATLGIADLLRDGPRGSDELAAASASDPRSLYRLLRALAGAGVFHEDGERRFSLTPIGECLRSDAAEPGGGWAVWIGQPSFWQAWGNLLHSVRTGENAFRHLYGTDPWGYRAERPELNAIFNAAMTANARRISAAVLAAYDFGRFRRIADIGGGQGTLLSAILTRYPGVEGILFDQPHVVPGAASVLEGAGVADRCRVVGGSFFEAVPDGADAYVLLNVIHDWDDTDAAAILGSIRRVIPAEGTLLMIERRIEPPNEGADSKFSDLNMLVSPGGQERTGEEYAALFGRAGFRLTGTVPTASPWSIFEGVPV